MNISDMTDEEKRVKIAEACGWKEHEVVEWPHRYVHTWRTPSEVIVTHLPDYLNDLNAMHEVEKVLTQKQRRKYCQRLWQLNGNGGYTIHWRLANATARQRADAFLMVL